MRLISTVCFSSAIMLAVLLGCTPEEDPKPEPEIQLLSQSQADLVFPDTASSINVVFSSSDAWTAQVLTNVPGTWCTVTPESGAGSNSATVTIKTEQNDDSEDRSATVVLLCSTAKATISVTQKSKQSLTVTNTQFDLGHEGGSFTIEAKTNVHLSWEIDEDCASWIHYVQTKAISTEILEFSVDANEGERRIGHVTIKGGELKETITVNQEATRPSIVIPEESTEIKAESGTVSIPVKANVPITVVIPEDVGWIHLISTKGMEDSKILLAVDENKTGELRSATIYLTNKENNINQPYTITQGYNPLAETEGFYTVGPEGGNIEIKLTTNLDNYRVSVQEDASSWLSFVSTKSIHTDILQFYVVPTDLYQTRQAVVSISEPTGNVITQFTIKQNAKATPNNEIWYTTKYGYVITPNADDFNCKLMENTYSDGYGRLVFNDDITRVGKKAFAGQTSLIGVTLPNSVKIIGEDAFLDCSSMTDIYLSNDLEQVKSGAFSKCTGTIHFNGKKLPDNCCLDAMAITGAVLGDKVEIIGKSAFEGCESLSSVIIPESLTIIETEAFSYCKSLTEILIPKQKITIDSKAFYGSGLKEFVWYEDYMTIRSEAFYNSMLEKVSFVEKEGNYSYSLASGIFRGTKISEIELTEHLYSIASDAFRDTPLKKITISSKVTSIGDRAFNNCTIPELICKGNKPPTLGSEVFNKYSSHAYVPEGSELTYAVSESWRPYILSGYLIGLNGFNNFLSLSKDYSASNVIYDELIAQATWGPSFPAEISAIGFVADVNEKSLTVDKAAYIDEIPLSKVKTENESFSDNVRAKVPFYLSCLKSSLTYYCRAYARFKDRDEIWYSVSQKNSISRLNNLSDYISNNSANCYLVKPGSTVTIPACFGNSNIAVPLSGIHFIWSSDGTQEPQRQGDIIADFYIPKADATGSKSSFVVIAGQKEGNAVLAAVDQYDRILWSWHIWVSSTGLDDMKQAYINVPSYIMDRNLGALTNSPEDARATGVVYQWGRKDPFPVRGKYTGGPVETLEATRSRGTMNYSVSHPNHIISGKADSSDWLFLQDNEPQRWSGTKWIFDPCPVGWRVPDGSVWEAASRNRSSLFAWDTDRKGADMQSIFETEDRCWYPATDAAGGSFLLWGCNQPFDCIYASPGSFHTTPFNPKQLTGAVRCVSEKGTNGNHEGSEEEDWNL